MYTITSNNITDAHFLPLVCYNAVASQGHIRCPRIQTINLVEGLAVVGSSSLESVHSMRPVDQEDQGFEY